MTLAYNKLEEDFRSDDGNEDPSYTSNLYQMLLEHTTQLYNDGSPTEEIEKFLHDHKAIAKFFESKGHLLQIDFCETDSRNGEVGKRKGIGDDDKDNHHRIEGHHPPITPEVKVGSSRLSKLLRVFIYLIVFILTGIGGHIVICHLMDVNPLQYFPSLQERRCLLPAHPILMEMTRPVADCAFCSGNSKGVGIIIEMKTAPSRSKFAKVAYLSKPVIIRGGGTSGGMPAGFNFYNLKDIFQSEPGGVDAVSEECQFLPFRSPFTSLREAFDKISENSSWVEPWYIGWSNCHPGVASKLRELFPRPDFLPDDSSSSAIDWIFIGSPGLGASMHIDYVKRPSWQAQLSGIKRWILHPPPECESICPESVTFTINPGDLLFLETNTWYHETFIDSDSLSISIGSEYD